MNGRWKMVTEPSSEPVSLSDAKSHLNVTHAEDDTLIGAYISAARQLAEDRTSRAFVTQTQDLYLDRFPEYTLQVRKVPLQSVSSITYLDSAGSTATLSSSQYLVDTVSEPARITPAYGESWPGTYPVANAVKVRCVLGYGTSDVPQKAKQAIRLMVGHYYANREQVVTGMAAMQVPFAADALLDSLDWGRYR